MEGALGEVELLHLGGDVLGAEPLGLLLKADHHVGTLDPLGKPGVVLDVGGGGELPSWLIPVQHDRLQTCPSGVDGCRRAGRPRTDDDDFLVFHDHLLEVS